MTMNRKKTFEEIHTSLAQRAETDRDLQAILTYVKMLEYGLVVIADRGGSAVAKARDLIAYSPESCPKCNGARQIVKDYGDGPTGIPCPECQ